MDTNHSNTAAAVTQYPTFTVQPKESALAWGYVDCGAYHLPGGAIDPSAYLFIRKDGKVELHTRFTHFVAFPQTFGVAWVILTGWVDTLIGEDTDGSPVIGKRQVRVAVPREAWSVAQMEAAMKMGVRKGQLLPAPPIPPMGGKVVGRVAFPVGAWL